uniref:Uncharacterized protein n=1 Tax=Oryza meridionalis TaxID=40149 RepID=A0A0E0F045_9ORYZ
MAPAGRRLFLADVVERLDAVCAEELEHADPSEQRLGRLDSARGCQWRHRPPTPPPSDEQLSERRGLSGGGPEH